MVLQVEALSLEGAGKGGRDSFGLGERQAPKVLGDIVESLIGATYLDTYGSLNATWRIWEPLIQPLHTPHTIPMHPVRELLELCQSLHWEVQFQRVSNPMSQGTADSNRENGRGRYAASQLAKAKASSVDRDSGSDEQEDEDEEEDLELEASVQDPDPDEERRQEERATGAKDRAEASGSRAGVVFCKERSGRHAVSELSVGGPTIKVRLLCDGFSQACLVSGIAQWLQLS